MKGLLLIPAVMVMALVTTGCASKSDVRELKREFRQEQRQVAKAQAAQDAKIAEAQAAAEAAAAAAEAAQRTADLALTNSSKK